MTPDTPIPAPTHSRRHRLGGTLLLAFILAFWILFGVGSALPF